MSTDFKALWNQEKNQVPDINEIFMKANQMSRRMRRSVWRQNLVMVLTIVFISWVWWHYQPQMLLTKIGIIMIIGAIIAFIAASNQLLPLLNNGNLEADSKQYLAQMIRLKQKQEFMGGTMMVIYFMLLSTGLALYMVEYASRGTLLIQILYYGITFIWIAFCWFYLAPRGVKKQNKAINEVIARLEEVNGQLEGE